MGGDEGVHDHGENRGRCLENQQGSVAGFGIPGAVLLDLAAASLEPLREYTKALMNVVEGSVVQEG